jgi:hypothetical protein
MNGLYNTMKKQLPMPNATSGYGYGIPEEIYMDEPTITEVIDVPNYPTITNGVVTKPTTATATGSNGLWSQLTGNSLGSNMLGIGSLMGGLGGLYGAYNAKNYYDDMSGMLDRQMGLYEQEVDRRNKTRDSYSNAFSSAGA